MKVLTLTQPWATLVALGAKRIETRSWQTRYRGPLAIHAAKGWPKAAQAICREPLFAKALDDAWEITLGAVIATGTLVDCLPTESVGCLPGVFDDYPLLDKPRERAFGDFSPGRWGWVLEDVVQLPTPIPAKGALGLWNWERP